MAADMNDDVMGADAEESAAPSVPTVLRRTRRILWIAAVVGVVMAALVYVLATRPPASTIAAQSPLLGKPAPRISGTTIDGKRVSISDYRGQWLLVNFFATWCVPCRKEHPDLIRFAAAHKAAGDAAVVGIIFDDSADAVRQFRREKGGDWPMLMDERGQLALDFGVAGVPESFLVSPDGYVVSKLLGGVTTAELDKLLAEAVARQTQRDRSGRSTTGGTNR